MRMASAVQFDLVAVLAVMMTTWSFCCLQVDDIARKRVKEECVGWSYFQ